MASDIDLDRDAREFASAGVGTVPSLAEVLDAMGVRIRREGEEEEEEEEEEGLPADGVPPPPVDCSTSPPLPLSFLGVPGELE